MIEFLLGQTRNAEKNQPKQKFYESLTETNERMLFQPLKKKIIVFEQFNMF